MARQIIEDFSSKTESIYINKLTDKHIDKLCKIATTKSVKAVKLTLLHFIPDLHNDDASELAQLLHNELN